MSEVQRLVDQLQEPSKRMLELLLAHLENVAAKADKNMMTVSNLGVCFGPTLLKDEEETVAAIMDIKFANVVVEILIENWRQILCGEPFKGRNLRRSSIEHSEGGGAAVGGAYGGGGGGASAMSPVRSPVGGAAGGGGLTVLPIAGQQPLMFPPGNVIPKQRAGAVAAGSSPPHRPPPPYTNPPPPPSASSSTSSLVGGTVATLAHAVIYNNGPKQVRMDAYPLHNKATFTINLITTGTGDKQESVVGAVSTPSPRQCRAPLRGRRPTAAGDASDVGAPELRHLGADEHEQRRGPAAAAADPAPAGVRAAHGNAAVGRWRGRQQSSSKFNATTAAATLCRTVKHS